MVERGAKIAPAQGRLGVLLPGLGAVSTTFIAGIELMKKGAGAAIGSLTQMGTIRLGKRTDNRTPFIKDFVPLAQPTDLCFGAWDIFPHNAYRAAVEARVLDRAQLDLVRTELEAIEPWPAVFDPEYVKRLDGQHVKTGTSKLDLAHQVMRDIETFRDRSGATRLVMVWCGSTESFHRPAPVHASLQAFEAGLRNNDPAIAPSMIYAYAALASGVPFANGAPNLTTNILGNRDGEVLDEPSSFRTKEESKLSVLDVILRKDLHPQLYGDYHHVVNINYYRPRGDNKEGWDNIDVFGWLGYPMQIKINFLCRDSILAAPLVLDLALFLDLAQRAGMHGIQEWLSFYFKSPQTAPGLYPEHDLFIQLMKLKNTLRYLRGEELITHLGLEYYD
jgi:myo-inositol-1-phosphate synthase